VGGTDGGDAKVLLNNARALAAARWRSPVVVAGNNDAAADVASLLDEVATPNVVAGNVVPRIGMLDPTPARAAIREMFLRHVIGGKQLSARIDFVDMVQGATPDVVLSAVELLARGTGPDLRGAGDVVVIDIGGATTDVHSVVDVDPEFVPSVDEGLSREVVATVPANRTVEADLGMRWSAVTTAAAAIEAGLAGPDLLVEAERRRERPAMLPRSPEDDAIDLQLASAAATIALRRHAGRQRVVFSPDGRLVERTGKDLREVPLLVGSGGVLRYNDSAQACSVLAAASGEHVEGGWLVPRTPRIVIDHAYVLAAAGLLAPEYPEAAYALLSERLIT
jgi:uncharacterized protein (TIGR01319 family)